MKIIKAASTALVLAGLALGTASATTMTYKHTSTDGAWGNIDIDGTTTYVNAGKFTFVDKADPPNTIYGFCAETGTTLKSGYYDYTRSSAESYFGEQIAQEMQNLFRTSYTYDLGDEPNSWAPFQLAVWAIQHGKIGVSSFDNIVVTTAQDMVADARGLSDWTKDYDYQLHVFSNEYTQDWLTWDIVDPEIKTRV